MSHFYEVISSIMAKVVSTSFSAKNIVEIPQSYWTIKHVYKLILVVCRSEVNPFHIFNWNCRINCYCDDWLFDNLQILGRKVLILQLNSQFFIIIIIHSIFLDSLFSESRYRMDIRVFSAKPVSAPPSFDSSISHL